MGLSLLPLLGLGALSYWKAQETLQNKVGIYSEQTIRQLTWGLNLQAERIEKLSTLILVDPAIIQNLADFSTQNVFDKSRRSARLKEQLFALAFSTPEVKQVILTIPHAKLIASRGTQLSRERNYFETDNFWNSPLYQEVLQQQGRPLWRNGMDGRFESLFLLRLVVDRNSSEAIGVLILELDPAIFSSAFRSMADSDAATLFILDEQYQAAAHSEPIHAGASFAAAYQHDPHFQNAQAQFVKDKRLTIFSAMNNGWKIVMEIPMAFLLKDIKQFRLWILAVAMIAGALVAAVSLILSGQYVKSINALVASSSAIASGNLEQPIDIRQQDEIGMLAGAFAAMRDEIKRKIEQLQQFNADLEQRVKERTAEIVRKNYILDSFMANAPDAIYFKDRTGRFIRLNQAHARLLGVENPDELVGKSDFDFYPEELAQPRYAREQEIIRTGQSLLNFEEPNLGGSWTLTSKMPLIDEYGEIIGTFGISRDITELKVAQQQVEEAYVEIQMLNKQLKHENLRMSAELDVARRLQQMVLPMPHELRQMPGLEIVGYMQPADEVGGDYYDVLHCQQGCVCIGIGDVTGHGLESGVLMLMTQTAIRTLIDRGETDPVIFLNTLNRVIYQNIQRMGVDRSLTLAMINYQAGQLRLIGQHEEVLVVRHDGQIERMDTVDLGFPIGMVDDIRQWVNEMTITLEAGDGVVLYTDGITEAQNAAGAFYSLERLCMVISAAWRETSAEAIKQAIIDDLRGFVSGAQVYDDVTLVVLKQT